MREDFRYILEKGSRKHICPDCNKKTFVLYIDTETGDYLPEQYGRCDRESKCSYHLNPYKDGYAKAIWEQEQGNRSKLPTNWKPKRKKAIPQPTPEPVFFDFETYKTAQAPARYAENVFLQNLIHRVPFPFPPAQVNEVAQLYQLGTIVQGYMAGAVTFPFIDEAGNIRAVQVKQFDQANHTTRTSFLHSIIVKHYTQQGEHLPGWLEAYTKQDKRITCLFGAHLLTRYPNNPIALVEAPKTAVYGTLYFGLPETPEAFIWLAVYNKSSFSFDKLKVLQGRFVYVFPDLSKDGSTFKEWQRKAKDFERRLPGTRFVFSDLLEQLAPEQGRQEGSDLADYLIRLDWRLFRQPQPTPAPAPTAPTELHMPQPDKKHQTTPTPAPAPTAAHAATTTAATPAPTAPPTAAVTPERPTENKKAKQQDATQPDQTDMIIQPRTDYSEAQIIEAIERIDKTSNGRQRLNRLINEGKLHRCNVTRAIYYVPF